MSSTASPKSSTTDTANASAFYNLNEHLGELLALTSRTAEPSAGTSGMRPELLTGFAPDQASSQPAVRTASVTPVARTKLNVLRIVPNISSDRFEATREFYVDVFDLDVSVDFDWYLQLMAPNDRSLNVGFLPPGSEFFGGRSVPLGEHSVVLTIEVDDVEKAYKRARRRGAEVPLELRAEDYGQRHFLLVDPNGLVLNVMSTI